ncbi:MAG: metallophosphoesterase [Myxococcota bacterium]
MQKRWTFLSLLLVSVHLESAPVQGAPVRSDTADRQDLGMQEPAVTPDRQRPSRQRLTVAVISDLNRSTGSVRYHRDASVAVKRIRNLKPDLVLSTGDMVAGMQAGLDYRRMWQSFHDTVSDPLAEDGIPFAVTPGNHDASSYLSYRHERRVFVSEWTARKPTVRFHDESHYPLRYSFSVGEAFFIALDATRVGALDKKQMEWVERQLESARSFSVKIVFGHLPLHPFTENRSQEILGDAELEALLNFHEVDLFLSGHHHAYYPGRRGTLRTVSLGCLGSGRRKLLGSSQPSEHSFVYFTIQGGAIVNLEAFRAPDFQAAISRSGLPPRVGFEGHFTFRDDLFVPHIASSTPSSDAQTQWPMSSTQY